LPVEIESRRTETGNKGINSYNFENIWAKTLFVKERSAIMRCIALFFEFTDLSKLTFYL